MRVLSLFLILVLVPVAGFATGSAETEDTAGGLIKSELPWWGWAALLFGFTVLLGILAVIGGVGGGVLFVPIVSAVFPFHFDYVRGAGLMVALCGALSASPTLLRQGLANIKLGLPFALVGALGSMIGATVGLALPTELVQGLLGVTILGIVALIVIYGSSEFPRVDNQDSLSRFLGISGTYHDPSIDRDVQWKVHRMPLALVTFLVIGLLAGMFGLGAGWANVPALNLLLGAPIKLAAGTSGFIITLNGPAAAWVYLNGGAVLPLIAVPSVVGMMIGTRIGARALPRIRARSVRWVVIGILAIAGVRSLLAGFVGV